MKRLFNILTPCLLMSLFTISCKKEHLTTQTNASPVFYFTGNIGGNAMDLRAGLNNYYMYSSYTQDANNVYNYSGTLKEYNCSSNCPPSIEFIINNYRTESPGVSEKHISDSSLITTYYNYSSPGGTPASFPVTFYPTKGDSAIIKSYTWNFGDGSTSSGKGNMVSIIHVYSHAANYTTSLSVIFSNNSSSSLTNDIQLGNPGVSFYCSAIDSNNAFSTAIYGGTKPYKYSWNFGDSSTSDTSSLPAPVHTYTNTSTVFPVSLIVTDSIGHTTSALTYAAATNGSGQQQLINYSTSAPKTSPNPIGLSNITVIYTDASGDQYTSNNPSQPDSSYFHVISVSNYQNNENNQSTKQVHAKFDCTLFDSTGKQLAIKNGEAVFAVAYK